MAVTRRVGGQRPPCDGGRRARGVQTVYAPNNPQSPVTLMKKGTVSLLCELELQCGGACSSKVKRMRAPLATYLHGADPHVICVGGEQPPPSRRMSSGEIASGPRSRGHFCTSISRSLLHLVQKSSSLSRRFLVQTIHHHSKTRAHPPLPCANRPLIELANRTVCILKQ